MKKFYIKERHNPQLGIYYVGCGRLTKKEAKNEENSLYGTNLMHLYDTEEDYERQLEDLRKHGKNVQ